MQNHLLRRRKAGVAQPPESPLAAAVDQWLLGSSPFVERIRRRAQDPTYRDEVPQARRLGSLPLDEVLEATAHLFDVDQAAFAQPRSAVLARDIAAWLARRLTSATLRELAAPFGLTHPDSVANLTRRARHTTAAASTSASRNAAEDAPRCPSHNVNSATELGCCRAPREPDETVADDLMLP